MKKAIIAALVAIMTMLCAVFFTGCFGDDPMPGQEESTSETVTTKLAFKETLPEFFTAGVPVNVSKLIDYEAGSALTVNAAYSCGDETGDYLVTGVTFTPDKIGKVTVTITSGESRISKEFEVKVAPPTVIEVREAELTKGETIDLGTLISYVEYTANADYPVVFKAVSYIPVGGDEDEDTVTFSDNEYAFDKEGFYELTFRLSNDGGEAEDVMFVSVKRALGDNEINDLSNYKRGLYIPSYASGTVTYDDVDHAANSDWSFMLKADATATAEAGGKESEGYWNQFGLIALEKNIDLAKSYIEMDIKLSSDARNYVGIGFMDEGESSVKYYWAKPDKSDEWIHLSMKYKLTEGNFKYIRIAVVHPFKSDNPNYNEGNVWVKIDNVKISDYDYPIVENGIIFDLEGSTTKRLRFMVSHNKTLNYVNQLAWGNNTTFTVSAIFDGKVTALNGYVEEAAPQVFWIEGINAKKGCELSFKKGEEFALKGNDDVEFAFTNDVTVYSDGEKWQKDDPYEGYVTLVPEYGQDAAFTVAGKDLGGISSVTLDEVYLNGVKTDVTLAINDGRITIAGEYADGDKIEIREDAVLTAGEEEMPVLGTVAFIRKGSVWVEKVVEVEPTVLAINDYIVVFDIVHGEELNYLAGGNAQTLSVNGKLDDVDTIFRGFVESANPQRLYFNTINVWQNFTPVKGTKIQIAAGSEIKIDENPQIAFVVKNEITVYFDGTNWTTEVVTVEKNNTLSGITLGSNTSASCFVFTFAEGEIPAGMLTVDNIGRAGNASGTLLTDGKCGDYSLYDLWTGIIASGNSVSFFVATPEGKPVEDGTRFYIPSGSVLTLGDDSFTLGEEISYVWLNGAWVKGTPKYMTGFVISDWSAGVGNASSFYIDNTTATLPGKVTNLLYNGLEVYLNDTALAKTVASCYADNPRLFIVTGLSAVKGDKLEVKKGAGFVLDGEIYVFGEGITVYFDGEHWTKESVAAD